MIFFQSCLLSATSRSQRVVALSSAEAELHAAVSATCDGILLRLCLVFCLNAPVRLKLMLDNVAAKQILLRSGVGRIRHLSCRTLWIQQHVRDKLLELAFVPTKWNVSDLCTKKLPRDRMEFLMYLAGVFDTSTDSLVGSAVMSRDEQQNHFGKVLRILVQSMDSKSVKKGKSLVNMLQLMLLSSMAEAP